MSAFLHQRPLYSTLSDPSPLSPRQSSSSQRPISLFSRTGLIALLSLLLILGVILPWTGTPSIFSSSKPASQTKWQQYTLSQAVSFVARNKTVIVCAVSQPYLPFLSNWLISISRQKHQDKVLVIAEDYATLYKVNEKWPGHAVLVPPAPDSQTAHKFGSQVLTIFNSLVHLFSINSSFLCWIDNYRLWQTKLLFYGFRLILLSDNILYFDILERRFWLVSLDRGFSISHPGGLGTCCAFWSLDIMWCTMMWIWSGCKILSPISRETTMSTSPMTWLRYVYQPACTFDVWYEWTPTLFWDMIAASHSSKRCWLTCVLFQMSDFHIKF